MVVLITEDHTVSLERTVHIERTCPACRGKSFGIVDALGQGTGTSVYGTGVDSAKRTAAKRAYSALLDDAIEAARLSPCRRCSALDRAARRAFWKPKAMFVVVAAVVFLGLGVAFALGGVPIVGVAVAAFGLVCDAIIVVQALRTLKRMPHRVRWSAFGEPTAEGHERKVIARTKEGDVSVYADVPISPDGEPVDDDDALRERANDAVRRQDFTEAKRALEDIRTPERKPDYSLLLKTAQGLERDHREEEAYACYRRLIALFPDVARANTKVVSSVRKMETARNVTSTIVPKPKRGLAIAIGAVVFVGASVGAFFIDGWLEEHRTLRITNGCKGPASVTIDGAPHIVGTGIIEVEISEGRHAVDVRLANGHQYTREIVVEDGLVGRWSGSTVFVFSVMGADVFLFEEVVYGDRSRNPEYEFAFGDDFYTFTNVDYAFRKPPRSISTKSGSEVRIALSRFTKAPQHILAQMLDGGAPDASVLRYAEAVVIGGHDHPRVLTAYRRICESVMGPECAKRAAELGVSTATTTDALP
ncbi:MAG: hypothetical protein RMA76_12450 [Deltaproteobacteria bacterium]